MKNNYNNHNSLVVVSLSPRFRVQTMIIKGVFGSVRFLVETQMKKQLLHMTSIRQECRSICAFDQSPGGTE